MLKRRDATDFKCGSWQNVPSEGSVSGGGGGELNGRGGKKKQQRELTYVMPTNSNVPIAPKTVACTEMQYVDPAEFIEKKVQVAFNQSDFFLPVTRRSLNYSSGY